ncbi:Mitochondria-eating protein [Folsomia candida]|uniref:Mitochondria-eating protein n=1 Tax=Folsomia candida TaxID=158441 RepID=A0A226EJA4_FOLCA|nr:Mitochondria-eating protein [Folsomia candida]
MENIKISDEIQERLIKNKSILNAVEPTLDNNCLDILLGILQRRVEVDKEALFQFTQLRKETGDGHSSEVAIVAPILMRYSRGLKLVLELMRAVGKEVGAYEHDGEEDSSDLSGYHSDSDSAIMTSGNSPFVTPRARYNFLSRSEGGKSNQEIRHKSNKLCGVCSENTTGSVPIRYPLTSVTPKLTWGMITTMRSKQGFRPSLMQSTWTGGNLRQIVKMSGPGSAKSIGGSSFDSSISGAGGGVGGNSPDDLMRRQNPTTTPIRPRHVKIKNQLHKNYSLGKVSTASTDSSTSGCGASLTPSEEDSSVGSSSPAGEPSTTTAAANGVECVECITVVSVPDNQVISQGMNHRCSKPGHDNNQSISPSSNSTSSSTATTESDFVQDLKSEIAQLKRQLICANSTIYQIQEKTRQTGGLLRKVQMEPTAEPMAKSDRKAELIREYGSLYAQARVETMDALDNMPELLEADELKSKLLFSVVVLAFRSVQTRLAEIKEQVSNLLQFELHSQSNLHDDQLQPCQGKLVEALSDYLLSSQQKFDQTRCVEHVASQLWTTLYDYPCLRKCEGLLKYITKCVNTAWRLSNMTPPCILDYETRAFSRTTHVRFHSSDQSSEIIKTYLWPALIEGGNGICIHKGVVIT